MADEGTFLGELERGWQRFWQASWRWKAGAAAVVAVVVIGAASAIAGGDDKPESAAQALATRTPSPAPISIAATPTAAPTPSPTPSPTDAPTPTPSPSRPSYQVVEKDDVSFASTVRIRVKATTEFPLTKDQARAVMDAIIEEVTDESKVNAVVVFLYDWQLVNSPFSVYTLAKATFAPDGEWGNASDVKAGDYSRHQTVYEFQPKMDDPQAAMADRPSQREAEICAAWSEAADKYSPGGELADEAIDEIVAASLVATAQEVHDATFKCVAWVFR